MSDTTKRKRKCRKTAQHSRGTLFYCELQSGHEGDHWFRLTKPWTVGAPMKDRDKQIGYVFWSYDLGFGEPK